jgi:hypothetical protein
MNRFARRPLTAALAFALAASGQQLRAADVEIRTPPGGNFAVRDSTGALLGLLVNGINGEVTVPFLTVAGVQPNLVCFQPGTGLLGQCATVALGPTGATGATGAMGATGATGAGFTGAIGATGDGRNRRGANRRVSAALVRPARRGDRRGGQHRYCRRHRIHRSDRLDRCARTSRKHRRCGRGWLRGRDGRHRSHRR